jgi:hypothetical protein
MGVASEISSMVIRLIGDGSSYHKMLDDAEAQSKSAAKTLERSGTKATQSMEHAVDQLATATYDASAAQDAMTSETAQNTAAVKKNEQQIEVLTQTIKKMEKATKKAKGSWKEMSESMRAFGARMTAFATTPILGAAVASVKLASDAEETNSKLKSVFSSISEKAVSMASTLQRSYFMSGTESKKLLGDTGDLLTGFGLNQAAALDLSMRVQMLSADLASYQNLSGGAADASNRLTKAMLGEKEGAKMLGIVYSEQMLKDKVKLMRAEGLMFANEQVAKSYAVLAIAEEQSKNAIGDLDRTAGSFANQLRATYNDIKTLAVGIGQDLMPYAKKLLEWVRSAISFVTNLDETTRKWAIGILAVWAVIGPLITAIGALIGVAAFLITAWPMVIGLFSGASAVMMIFAAKLALVVAGMYAAWQIGTAVGTSMREFYTATSRGTDALADYAAAQATSEKLQKKINDRHVKTHENTMKEIKGVKDRADREKFLRAEVAKSMKEQAGYALMVKMGQKEVQGLSTAWNMFRGSKVLEEASVSLEQTEGQLQAAKARTDELNTALSQMGLSTGTADKKMALLGLEADNLAGAIGKEIEMFGKSGHEAEIYALKLKGATDEQLASARAELKKLDAMKKEAENKAIITDTITALTEQRDAIGKTAKEQQILNMTKAGAHPLEVAYALALQETIAELQHTETVEAWNQKMNDQIAVLGMSTNEAAIYREQLQGMSDDQINEMRASAERLKVAKAEQSLREKGASLMKKHMAPVEKYAEAQQELSEMLSLGSIDLLTYNSALDDARKAMEDAEKQSAKDYMVDLQVKGVEAVEAGTAEAGARLREFIALRDWNETGVSAPTQSGIAATSHAGPAMAGSPGGVGAPTGVFASQRIQDSGAAGTIATGPGNAEHQGTIEELLARIAEATEASGLIDIGSAGFSGRN